MLLIAIWKKKLDLAEVIGNQNRVTVIQVLYVKTNKLHNVLRPKIAHHK